MILVDSLGLTYFDTSQKLHEKIKKYIQMIDRQFEQKVKVIRTDNAKDFLNSEFYHYYIMN